MAMTMGNTQFERSEGHIRRQRLLKVWHDSVDCEGADVDNETQKNTDELYPQITLLDSFFFSFLSSKNKFKATFYLNHNDNSAKRHHKGHLE